MKNCSPWLPESSGCSKINSPKAQISRKSWKYLIPEDIFEVFRTVQHQDCYCQHQSKSVAVVEADFSWSQQFFSIPKQNYEDLLWFESVEFVSYLGMNHLQEQRIDLLRILFESALRPDLDPLKKNRYFVEKPYFRLWRFCKMVVSGQK